MFRCIRYITHLFPLRNIRMHIFSDTHICNIFSMQACDKVQSHSHLPTVCHYICHLIHGFSFRGNPWYSALCTLLLRILGSSEHCKNSIIDNFLKVRSSIIFYRSYLLKLYIYNKYGPAKSSEMLCYLFVFNGLDSFSSFFLWLYLISSNFLMRLYNIQKKCFFDNYFIFLL